MTDLNTINIVETNERLHKIQQLEGNTGLSPEITGDGVVLLKNFSSGITGTGKPKYTGTIANIEEARFNVWNNSPAYSYFEQLPFDSLPLVIWINYTLSKYGLVINAVQPIEGYEIDEFLCSKYNETEIGEKMDSALRECNLSENGYVLMTRVLQMGESNGVCDRFFDEYASLYHHDNCKYGLISHTTKCLQIYAGLKDNYAFLSDTKTNDLMIIGILFHDIGKIFEMHNGVYQRNSFLTHRGLGFEFLVENKAHILELYDEEFFYMLSSIILQHHGEYGETPKTVYALLVHMIDNIESLTTTIDDLIQSKEFVVGSSGTKIKIDEGYLNILSR